MIAKRKNRGSKPKLTFNMMLEETEEKSKFKMPKKPFKDIPNYKKNVVFGFKFCKEKGKYSIEYCCEYEELLKSFKWICSKNWEQIVSNDRHYHKSPEDKSIKQVFKEIAEELKDFPVFFQLGTKTQCRIIGFHNPEDTFEIVLIDDQHEAKKRK